MITSEKANEVRQQAMTLYTKRPDWMTFYREILGLRGLLRQSFPTQESLAEFEQTETYREIQQMLSQLRTKGPAPSDTESADPTKVITVRLPKSIHDALKREAFDCRTSMNKLCISKLLQYIDQELVPAEVE